MAGLGRADRGGLAVSLVTPGGRQLEVVRRAVEWYRDMCETTEKIYIYMWENRNSFKRKFLVSLIVKKYLTFCELP